MKLISFLDFGQQTTIQSRSLHLIWFIKGLQKMMAFSQKGTFLILTDTDTVKGCKRGKLKLCFLP